MTLGHWVLRISEYQTYPTKLFRLCRRVNPVGWVAACYEFLRVPEAELDVGYSLPLQREAWRTATEAEAVSFLMSDRVQEELGQIFRIGHGTSLDVERKIAHDKRNEHSRLVTVARVSRNTIPQ